MKKVFIIIVAFLLTGCSADCTLTINKDLSMKESVTVLNATSVIESGYDLPKTGIMARINTYHNYEQFGDYTYKLVLGDIDSGATFNRDYDSINNYDDSFFMTWLFNKMALNQKGNLVTATFNLSDTSVFAANQDDPSFVFDYANINVKIPYKITTGNYDSINTDTATWNYTATNLKNELTFTFDTSTLTDGTKIKKPVNINDVTTIITTKKDNFNMLYILIPIFGIIFLGAGIIFAIYKKKNNV